VQVGRVWQSTEGHVGLTWNEDGQDFSKRVRRKDILTSSISFTPTINFQLGSKYMCLFLFACSVTTLFLMFYFFYCFCIRPLELKLSKMFIDEELVHFASGGRNFFLDFLAIVNGIMSIVIRLT